MADPQALVIANAAKDAYDFLGSPEGELAIAQAVIYVATAPKSNAAYMAYGAAKQTAKENGSLLPPKHILNAPTNLMKSEGYGRGYCLRPRRRGRVLRPGLLPGRARPPAVLRSARARLRARDQEAAGILGEAPQRARLNGHTSRNCGLSISKNCGFASTNRCWLARGGSRGGYIGEQLDHQKIGPEGLGIAMKYAVLAACALGAGFMSSASAAEQFVGRWAVSAEVCGAMRRRHVAKFGAGCDRHLALVVRRLLPHRQDVQAARRSTCRRIAGPRATFR